MNRPDPQWLMHKFGYVPARSTQVAVFQAVGLLALGALCGAATVALFTPKSGPQLRGDIAAQANRLRGRVGEKARQIKEKASSMKDSGNEMIDELRDVAPGA